MEEIHVYKYLEGFGNHFVSEALPDALPKSMNSMIVVVLDSLPNSLYNQVKIHLKNARQFNGNGNGIHFIPDQIRWSPFNLLEPHPKAVDFVSGLHTLAGAGDPTVKHGLAIHMYNANQDMVDTAFYNSDGDFLIVPQHGRLDITTEFGRMLVAPCEITVIPRGIKFSVNLPDGPSRGYILEVFENHFELPDLGPIGSYEAKSKGFLPGGASLHSFMTPHGPDATSFEKASNEELKPVRANQIFNHLAFMFESSLMLGITSWGVSNKMEIQHDYYMGWQELKSHFNANTMASK
ncbi:15931_t:CDS:2 [Acaulospora colombiana]|uniref:15931_t:CDS:1 n=1 Tax=Acaulospora colombiana TaxID=27376 RepID=A0ACA9L9U9_9GLOM|nr:15931_t:CDS:2 [Acaulospora colombiana]